jgi:tetratricopeptide (TPR) repeat protein
MSLSTFKKGLTAIKALKRRGAYGAALARVEELLRAWPDNPHLLLLRSTLIQLGDESSPPLEEARAAIERGIALDPDNPIAHLELGWFKYAIEDNAKQSVRHFEAAIDLAQRLLRDALTGKAKALAELGQREEALGCLAAAYWQETRAAEILRSLEELRLHE